MKHSLSTTGLSMSQAQSISNLCNQRVRDIENQIVIINNAEKSLKIGTEVYIDTKGNKIPSDIVALVVEKGRLSATQAFLMENIKAKDHLITSLKTDVFVSPLQIPEYPNYQNADMERLVDEKWGWDQLSIAEYNEFLEAEAYAAHIGQFIHKGSKLDTLRNELSTVKTLEWITVKDGEKTPMTITVHHTAKELSEIHENFAALHRTYENRVNYFKAKVKNLVTEENARISRMNADNESRISKENEKLRREYNDKYNAYETDTQILKQEFEQKRQNNIKDAAALRIVVDMRFKPVVDGFLAQLGKE